MYSWIARNLLAKTLDLARGTSTIRCLDQLEKSQWRSKNDIFELQNERLRSLINYAHDNVPYYSRVFRERALQPQDIRDTRDLVKLPELNKNLVRSNFADMKSRAVPRKEMLSTATSGSTGEPLIFYSTKEDQINRGYARALRARGWAGCSLGDKTVILRETRQRGLGLRERKITGRTRLFFERSLELDPALLSTDTMAYFRQKMEDFNPRLLFGYPSAIGLLANFIKRNGKTALRPRAVQTIGEQLNDHQRRLIEEVFECKVYDAYSAWEAYEIASECPEHTGLHIAAEDMILEVVDDAGIPVPAGKEGRILLTNLHNYAMPLIRYEIGDLGTMSDRDCPCGRWLPLLAAVNGRVCDAIMTRSKGTVPGMSLPWDFLAQWKVEQFQIVQEDIDRLVVRLVFTDSVTEQYIVELSQEIRRRYVTILGQDMNIVVEPVDQILPLKSGKRQIVVSKLASQV
jgi:phenylacetate-CoA ligase